MSTSIEEFVLFTELEIKIATFDDLTEILTRYHMQLHESVIKEKCAYLYERYHFALPNGGKLVNGSDLFSLNIFRDKNLFLPNQEVFRFGLMQHYLIENESIDNHRCRSVTLIPCDGGDKIIIPMIMLLPNFALIFNK